MRKFAKSDKVGDLIKHGVSNALLTELDVEKLRWVTVTEVRVNRDMKIADVYYTVLDAVVSREEAAGLIAENLYLVKRYLARNTHLRQIPELRFKYDDVEDKARHIEKLLGEIPRGKEDER